MIVVKKMVDWDTNQVILRFCCILHMTSKEKAKKSRVVQHQSKPKQNWEKHSVESHTNFPAQYKKSYTCMVTLDGIC